MKAIRCDCSMPFLCAYVLLITAFASLSAPTSAQTVDWLLQFGTDDEDHGTNVSVDSLGNVYVVGRTSGALGSLAEGNFDAFIRKYDSFGTELWTQQMGSNFWDSSFGVSADGHGNVYVSGSTRGSLSGPHAGNSDAFISKYSASGSLLWTDQYGDYFSDDGAAVTVDGTGNVYVTGLTYNDLGGAPAGGADIYLRKYDSTGTLHWTKQPANSSQDDQSHGIVTDNLGNIYVSGETGGSLGAPNAGRRDAFLREV